VSNTFRLKSLTVKNVQGAEHWSGDLGRIRTIFKGENGVGKSTLLNATRNVLYGAASLASIGRYDLEPEVVIVLEGIEGKKIITKTGDKTPVIKSQVGTSAAFELVKKPGEYLRSIYEASADPAKFLTSAAKDQLEMLLSALPVEWNQARADEILGEFKSLVEVEHLPMEHLYPLQKVAALHGAIFRARQGVNRDEKAKRSAADQTLRDAPAEIPQGVEDRISEKRAQIATLQGALSAGQEAWRSKYRAAEASAIARRDAAIAAAKAAYDAEMAEANRLAAEDKAALSEASGTLDRANLELSTLLRDQTDASKVVAMHETAAKFIRDADSLAGTADRMTATLAALDSFRAELVKDIPIVGLTIDDGIIKIGGVKFEQVNSSTRVGVAFSIATLRLKGLPLQAIFVDGLECLDDAHRSVLYRLAQANKVQLFGAMRTEGPLSVERA
jgi:hypothetical protein